MNPKWWIFKLVNFDWWIQFGAWLCIGEFFLVKIMKLQISVNGEFSLVKSSHDVVESIWWRHFFDAVNFVNGEMVDGGGAVKFLEEYERKIPNSSAFNSAKIGRKVGFQNAPIAPKWVGLGLICI